MSAETDLIVVGAGPAGASAAIAAAESGLAVALVDMNRAAGGQVWRAARPGLPADAVSGRDSTDGARLRERLAASKVRFHGDLKVWSAAERFRVDLVGEQGTATFRAPRLIAATGAHERVVPFPGWTLPGVIGLAAATVLAKSEAMIPAGRVVVAGVGPLLVAVAAKIAAGGGDVAAVVDLAPRSAWLRTLPALARRPGQLADGARWLGTLLGARVPLFSSHTIVRAEGEDRLQRVVLAPVDADGRLTGGPPKIIEDVAMLVVGHGLVPGSEIPRLLGATHHFVRPRGGWVPVLDPDGRTSVTGLYAAGDGTGIRGAAPAVLGGALAGLAAARDAGAIAASDFERRAEDLRRQQAPLAGFADAIAGLMALRPRQVADIAPDTIVCRCEDVTRAEIDAALTAGARDISQLKHFTRCGMGPCQGRMCGDVVGELAALRLGSREAAGQWTGRPPLHPVPLSELTGASSYDDIPVPKPAPL